MSHLRKLPSVDELARSVNSHGLPYRVVIAQARVLVEEARQVLVSGETPSFEIQSELQRRIQLLTIPSLRRVINASGVVLHTNLGRAPLSQFHPISGYSNLEYDLASGKRGKRDVHTADLLKALLKCDAMVVNNNASAVFLVLHELAAGHEVIVSRGELVEIGDGFRIPDIMAHSGAVLREVGTTNRTRVTDYAAAISERTRLILRVHPSNFHITGFTERPELKHLASLGRERGIPVYEDLGSGCLVDLSRFGVDEPLVNESLEAGANLVSFSCDKLLGGPQSGIIAGDQSLLSLVRCNPMYRAFRVDKLVIEALQKTLLHLLREEWDAVPALRMIAQTLDVLQRRAERIVSEIPGATLFEGRSLIGGGATPEKVLSTWVVAIHGRNASQLEFALRNARIPVIARVEKKSLLLDMRTLAENELEDLIEALRIALD